MPLLGFLEAAQQVKNQLDIVSIVSRAVTLKKAGRHYSGLCPFHPEKTPSFTVSREKNLFYCFGCGKGGDAVAFMMAHEARSYSEVIRQLAQEQGIDIRDSAGDDAHWQARQAQHDKLLAVTQAAQTWFLDQLHTHAAGPLPYLQQRGLGPEAVAHFGLGFAPPGWENLLRQLQPLLSSLQADTALLVEAGLAVPRQTQAESGEMSLVARGCYDRFRHRLMIPISDGQGRLVGFGGRALDPEDSPKYLNSPETPLFVKNQILYGLHQAREGIRRHKQAVVMEGYFDVIAAHQAGVTEAVGTCGTAFTEAHLRLLSRLGVETLYFCFDSDAAGQRATLAAIALVEQQAAQWAGHIRLKVVRLPAGKDPDDFFRAGHTEADFRALLAAAPSYLTFRLEAVLAEVAAEGLASSEFRVAASSRLAPLLGAIAHPVLRAEMISTYAQRLDLAPSLLQELVAQKAPDPKAMSAPPMATTSAFQNHRPASPAPWKNTRKNAQAISLPSASSFKGIPSLPNRQQAAENQVMALLFTHPLAPDVLHPHFAGVSFQDALCRHVAQWLAGTWPGLAKASPQAASLGVLLAEALPGPTDNKADDFGPNMSQDRRVTWASRLAAWQFQADVLRQVLRLDGMPEAQVSQTLMTHFRGCQGAIASEQRRAQLHALAVSLSKEEKAFTDAASLADDGNAEAHLLDLQYQLRAGLAHPNEVATL
jgi:DNA primase catalytic core